MHWFYPEEKAARTFRRLGLAFTLFSLLWFAIAYFSYFGPGGLDAIREALAHLRAQYGAAHRYSFSTKPASSGPDDYLVTYDNNGHLGVLHATWSRDHYQFSKDQ